MSMDTSPLAPTDSQGRNAYIATMPPPIGFRNVVWASSVDDSVLGFLVGIGASVRRATLNDLVNGRGITG